MSSCILYHGPGAEEAALEQAYLMGRLLEGPIGAKGLKVDDARHVVDLLSSVPAGDEKGIVVVGPIEMANYKAADVLLKSIEEFDGRFVQPILWSQDLGGVSPTIRSRCLDRWAPASSDIPENDVLVALGFDLIHAALAGEEWSLPSLVKGYLKNYRGGEYDILQASTDALLPQLGEERARKLWGQLRKAAGYRNPTAIEVIAAFLPSLEDLP